MAARFERYLKGGRVRPSDKRVPPRRIQSVADRGRYDGQWSKSMTRLSSRRRAEFERSLVTFDKSAFRSFDSSAEAEEADDSYWMSRTPEERLIALEHIRQLAWGYDDESRPQLRRSPELLKLRRRPLPGARRVRG